MTTVNNISTLSVINNRDERGDLGVAEFKHLPFKPKRVFWITNASGVRGGHAHRTTEQIFYCLRGYAEVLIKDGMRRVTKGLGPYSKGLYIPPMLWDETTMSANAVLLVLASTTYTVSDYISNWDKFCKMKTNEG